MDRASLYRFLGRFSLVLSAGAAGLLLVAVTLVQGLPALASGLCAAIFFVPGVAFLSEAYRIRAREAALHHIASFAEGKGVTDAAELAADLRISKEDAERILRRAHAAGAVRGAFDDKGRFVAGTAPRCPRCGNAVRKDGPPATCPACGAPTGVR